jgi:Protein of unknown function (DUF3147)
MSGAPRIHADLGKVKATSWKGYAIRFLFGGAVTALAGWIAATYGPVVGGPFLAFPAILPASVTLVRRHENAQAAGQDAYGAMLGSVGLLAFGAVVWEASPHLVWWLVLLLALAAWFAASLIAYVVDRWHASTGRRSARK